MELTPHTNLHGFTVLTKEPLDEIDGEAFTAQHELSGAKLLYLKNDDNNKSFAIGFRTPPRDDTGVFHILEHSVLCGSRKFPVKEPFVDLLKSSMQTFLNAMTFPDKTLYPVASTNEQDLYNLMDVYLDAVFHPQIYTKKAVFEQEGWHFELVAKDGQDHADDLAQLPADDTVLQFNGVVYNEMKGALSDASAVLYDKIQQVLFPDTCYAFESGGTPNIIPTLTYEDYLDEHRRHYRTDNSYIILYGNLDIDRALKFLDEEYLTPVAHEQHAADLARESEGLPALEPRTIQLQAPVTPAFFQHKMDTPLENACAGYAFIIGDSSQRERIIATDILLDALMGSNEAPLKRVLLNRGVAHDIQAQVSDGVLQPFALVQLQMPEPGTAAHFPAILQEEVKKLLADGLDMALIEAALSHAEFEMREHDLGMADGVIYAMQCLSGWLYDDDAAVDYLRYQDVFADLRAQLTGDYFADLLRSLFCENDHTASAEIVPTPGENKDFTAHKLGNLNRALTPDQRAEIVAEERTLRELQEAPDSPQDAAKLPRLQIADIDDAPHEPAYARDYTTPIACVHHEVPTNGIAYAYRYFDMNCVPFEDLPYVSVLAQVLGKLDTAQHTAAELDTLMQAKLGDFTVYSEIYENKTDVSAPRPFMVVSSSALSENISALAQLPREVLTETLFEDADKVLDILKQRKIAMEQAFVGAGHNCAAARLCSYFRTSGVLREQMGNVGFYRFLCELLEDYEARSAELMQKLANLAKLIFNDATCTVSFAGSDEDFDAYWDADPACGSHEADLTALKVPAPVMANEAFIVPSDVCFASIGWDRRLLDLQFSGTWIVASRALTYDYLWNEVRVKGGAYGVGFQALRKGDLRFYSYRDPHLDETLERFGAAAAWLHAFAPTQEQLDGFVVASVAGIDAPVKPRALIRRQMGEYFTDRSPLERIAIRKEIIQTTGDDLRDFAQVVNEAVNADARCAFGSRQIIESSKIAWDTQVLVG